MISFPHLIEIFYSEDIFIYLVTIPNPNPRLRLNHCGGIANADFESKSLGQLIISAKKSQPKL